ncbi:hypothetical protein BJ138DRAFT_1102979 [Hygrophoropsis aurantiaca]|uniref:Uncharacterized protein n=1 Tax=Hygrophoropsis aurantiaca TaxID=72124 RepID=A0ACB8A6Y1_9AGAM|nr:hypothetical protein BJ138DRAFT_1102979 [Hygrophoropsis aurantiaca]
MTRYATLSHRWVRHEPNFKDLKKNRNLVGEAKGYDKLQKFCDIARVNHMVQFAWANTVCIDKSSSAELDESIRSMFKWYANATVCIAYLAGMMSLSDMTTDPWFTRGWTLQEFLASKKLKFYNRNWVALTEAANNKEKHDERGGQGILHDGYIWSLFSVAYGEGSEHAFCRLLRAIIDISPNLDIFNWAGRLTAFHPSRMLPSSPECYLKRYKTWKSYFPFEPPILTSDGIRLKMLVVPVSGVNVEKIGTFHSERYTPSQRRELP